MIVSFTVAETSRMVIGSEASMMLQPSKGQLRVTRKGMQLELLRIYTELRTIELHKPLKNKLGSFVKVCTAGIFGIVSI